MATESMIDAAPASPGANSYATVEQADAYMETRFPRPVAWEDAPGSEEEVLESKERALITASRMIDSLPLRGRPLRDALGWTQRQGLFFPESRHPYLTGTADSGDTETLVDGNLAGTRFTDGFFAGGAIHVVMGANLHEVRRVAAFEAETGTLTVSPAFPEAIDSSTVFYLAWPLDPKIVAAACEQALYLIEGASFEALDEAAKGRTDHRIGNLAVGLRRVGADGFLCARTRALLAGRIARELDAQRGGER